MMDEQFIPVEETPEQLEARRSMSESQAMRDQASSELLQDQRRREGRAWDGGF
jgi:hypothetical protein